MDPNASIVSSLNYFEWLAQLKKNYRELDYEFFAKPAIIAIENAVERIQKLFQLDLGSGGYVQTRSNDTDRQEQVKLENFCHRYQPSFHIIVQLLCQLAIYMVDMSEKGIVNEEIRIFEYQDDVLSDLIKDICNCLNVNIVLTLPSSEYFKERLKSVHVASNQYMYHNDFNSKNLASRIQSFPYDKSNRRVRCYRGRIPRCDKFRHQVKLNEYGRCECKFEKTDHPINVTPCDKVTGCRACLPNQLSKWSKCRECDLDSSKHAHDPYCICGIEKMDAVTLRAHYVKCMDPGLQMGTMPMRYFTKFAICSALRRKVKIEVPKHEVKVRTGVPKQSISKSLRQLVWNEHIGASVGETLCPLCNENVISPLRFHCAHVIAEANGGTATIDNLKPTCDVCNGSMGTQNLNEFARTLKRPTS